jgi:hypothetical protein
MSPLRYTNIIHVVCNEGFQGRGNDGQGSCEDTDVRCQLHLDVAFKQNGWIQVDCLRSTLRSTVFGREIHLRKQFNRMSKIFAKEYIIRQQEASQNAATFPVLKACVSELDLRPAVCKTLVMQARSILKEMLHTRKDHCFVIREIRIEAFHPCLKKA